MRREQECRERDGDEPRCKQAGDARAGEVLRLALSRERENGVVSGPGGARGDGLAHRIMIGIPPSEA